MTAHALLGASSSERWLKCTPSARLAEKLPNRSSVFAEEGTLGHSLGELEIRRLLGETVDETALLTHELYSNSLHLSAKEYADFAFGLITDARARNPDADIMLEKRLDFSEWVPEGFGTGDLVTVSDGVIDICDLKMGKGVPVSAFDNSQLKLYALGAYAATDGMFNVDKVQMTIHQPRLDSVSTEVISINDLLAWGESIKPIAQKAWDGTGEFVPGDHCRFCPAKGTCKARADINLAIEPTDPRLLTLAEAAAHLDHAKQLKAWVSDLEEYLLGAALAGEKVPDYKLVAGRSIRKYSDPDAIAERLIQNGYDEALLYERSLLGITALEKVIGKKTFTELLEDLVVKPPGAPTLVHSSDSRTELTPHLEGFQVIE